MTDVAHPSHAEIEAAVTEAVSKLVSGGLGDRPHLTRAIIAERVSAVAFHLTKTEVHAAVDDGASWDDVGHAFGISSHDAHDRFRWEPMGLSAF